MPHRIQRSLGILIAAVVLTGVPVSAGLGPTVTVEYRYGYPMWTPTAAYDEGTYRWLVAYTDVDGPSRSGCDFANSCRANVTARLISSSGSVIREVIIARTDYEAQKEPHVAFNQTNAQYLVVYYDNTAGDVGSFCELNSDIYGLRVSRNGYAIGSPKKLSTSAYNNWHNVRPKVSWNAHTNEYMVVWQAATLTSVCKDGISADWRVRAIRVNSNGDPVGSVFSPSIDANTRAERPDIQVNYDNGEFLVVWEDTRNGTDLGIDNHIVGAMLTKYGARKFGNDLLIGTSVYLDYAPKIDYNDNRNEWVATWHTNRDNSYVGDIWSQRLRGSDAFWIGAPKLIFDGSGTLRAGFPAIKSCKTTGKLLLAYQTSDGKIRYKRYNDTYGVQEASGTVTNNGKAVAFADDHCITASGQAVIVWESIEGNLVQTLPKVSDANIYARDVQ